MYCNKYLLISLTASFIITHPCYAVKTELVALSKLRGDITYVTYKSPDFPLMAHVIIVPLDKADLQLQLAEGQREEVSSIAKRTGAFIAVNGANYRRGGRYNGNRLNLLSKNGAIYADLQLARGSFAWNNDLKSAIIAPISLHVTLSAAGTLLPVDSINQPRNPGQSVLYNERADVSLLGHTPGFNIIIADTMMVVSSAKQVLQQTTHGWYVNNELWLTDFISTAPIPPGWHVYQADNETAAIEPGTQVELSCELRSAAGKLQEAYDFVLGGAGLLIQDGTILSATLYDEFSQGGAVVHSHDEVAADFHTKQMQEWLIELRHPRTAIGITKNNELCIVVIDGKQAASEGLNLHELAYFMKDLGCVHAVNIGGGGCTTLYIDGIVVNTPSANEERPVSEALCLCVPATS